MIIVHALLKLYCKWTRLYIHTDKSCLAILKFDYDEKISWSPQKSLQTINHIDKKKHEAMDYCCQQKDEIMYIGR